MKNYEDYTEEEIEEMRERLAAQEWQGLKIRDLEQCLWTGFRGWVNIPDHEIIDLHNATFADELEEWK